MTKKLFDDEGPDATEQTACDAYKCPTCGSFWVTYCLKKDRQDIRRCACGAEVKIHAPTIFSRDISVREVR